MIDYVGTTTKTTNGEYLIKFGADKHKIHLLQHSLTYSLEIFIIGNKKE